MTGIIIKALSGFYYVACQDKVYECKARGSFRKSGVSPLVGDRVEFEIIGAENGVIDKVLPRNSCLSRPPVANIQKLFIVSAFASPSPNCFLIDKLTVIAEHNKIEPIIVFNKSDMGDFTAWQRIYHNAGFKTFILSAKDGNGTDSLINELRDCVSAFTGNSGVGKSSILNRFLEKETIKTGEISVKLGRGKHTTRHTQLYRLPFGGFVADTPGFSSIEAGNCDYSFKENLAFYFRDFDKYLGGCRFGSCTHTGENGCAVVEAVKKKEIEPTRHQSYVALFNELKDLKPWENKNRK